MLSVTFVPFSTVLLHSPACSTTRAGGDRDYDRACRQFSGISDGDVLSGDAEEMLSVTFFSH
jgi:hypothetical protein